MNNINEIKLKIKRIQKNFNPEKATYKILNDILTEDYTPEEIIEYMGKIKGIEKYPEELKYDFLEIIKDLKKLIIENQINESKEEIVKPEEKDENEEDIDTKKEENTKELKAIIDALEDTSKQKKKVSDLIKEESEEDLGQTESLDELVNDESTDDSTIASKVFKIVLAIVIFCILLAIGLVLFY